ncbi:MAG: pyruvate oxidase [Aerococcus suis]|nr:pyruvate oxidase [Aerococcus suis]MDD7759086.1 pyruvate oxidase [Aerococcus suis]
MMSNKISAAKAALNVLKTWDVDTIYGIPSGTLGTLMDALAEDNDINFLQVRHEETGSLAAVMQYKFNNRLGVAVGSGGPGATHLINGVYDAAMDNIPFLAVLGSRPNQELNLDAFQELNQNPMYSGIAVYNKRVAYAEQLPKVIDEAARTAIARKGPAVVEIPVDFGGVEIEEDSYYGSGKLQQKPLLPEPKLEDINKAVKLLEDAERPLIYAGFGANESGDIISELAHKIKAPILTTGKNFDAFHWNDEALAGSVGRVAWKTGNETLFAADTILFLGSNYPFAEIYHAFSKTDKFIQVDIDPFMLGKRHKADLAILADANYVVKEILGRVSEHKETGWWRATTNNIKNWHDYTNQLETKSEGPLQLYQVYNAINEFADEDAIYSIDVGNMTQTSIRHLHMTPKNMWRTSPLFATMGIALPGGIAAKKEFPNRQVWNIIGDGAFNMSYPDVVTNVQYDLPVINVVMSNTEYGYIKNKYEDTNKHLFGTDFIDVDYAKIAEAQGAVGYTVTRIEDIKEVVRKAVEDNKNGKTVVIDAKITHDRPFPVEVMQLDEEKDGKENVEKFKKRYEAESLIPLRKFLEEEGLY